MLVVKTLSVNQHKRVLESYTREKTQFSDATLWLLMLPSPPHPFMCCLHQLHINSCNASTIFTSICYLRHFDIHSCAASTIFTSIHVLLHSSISIFMCWFHHLHIIHMLLPPPPHPFMCCFYHLHIHSCATCTTFTLTLVLLPPPPHPFICCFLSDINLASNSIKQGPLLSYTV